MNCGNCRHFHPTLNAAAECHRNPPTVVAMMLPNGQMKVQGVFVPTKVSNFCGEHAVAIATIGA